LQHRFLSVLAAALLSGPALPACGTSPGAASSAVAPAAMQAAAPDAELPEVVARVNGDPIPREEFERAVRSAEVRAGQVVPASLRAAVHDRVLDRLVVFHLLLQESETRQLVVDDADVDAEIARIREGFPSAEAFEAQLGEWGTTLEELRTERRRDLLIAKLIDADVTPRIAVGDEAVRAFYDRHPDQFAETEAVRASHILIETESDAAPAERDDARARAEAIRSEAAAAGADFAALAREHSDDPGSAANGGDLGLVVEGQTVSAFEAALFALEPGELSDVVETPFGFHVIQMVERRDDRVVPFEEARGPIGDLLLQQEQQARAAAFMEELKTQHDVRILI
jgi:peptidyl-prolyl cis-trans isomerase C